MKLFKFPICENCCVPIYYSQHICIFDSVDILLPVLLGQLLDIEDPDAIDRLENLNKKPWEIFYGKFASAAMFCRTLHEVRFIAEDLGNPIEISNGRIHWKYACFDLEKLEKLNENRKHTNA